MNPNIFLKLVKTPAAGVSDFSPSPPQGSLSCHAPKDQAYSQILEHVYSQLSNTH